MEAFQTPDLFVITVKNKAFEKPTPIEVCMTCTALEMIKTGGERGEFLETFGDLWFLSDVSDKRLILSIWLDKYIIEYAIAANQRRGTAQCNGHCYL